VDRDTIAIKTQNLTKRFGNRTAVNDLNIQIKQGEIFSLLGTNGAGKTTTIKMLCCLLQPTSGHAEIKGFSIKEKPLTIKEIIGVSPQETAIAGHLSSRENLLLMGGVSGLVEETSAKKARHLMDLLKIEDRKDQARRLSGGLQRRLSIAMALMSDPQILFLDEPTLGLDPHARKSVWSYIEKLKKQKTILLTTHYLEEADSLADTIAIMDSGSIIETGPPHELKKKYTGARILKISGEYITQGIAALLRKCGIGSTLVQNGIEIESDNIEVYTIIDILRQNNVIITGIQLKEPTLDDVFLHLTGKQAMKCDSLN
jgi:ABC-2 type transport system ATP-binding protein